MPANNPRERILREIHRRTRVVGGSSRPYWRRGEEGG